MGTNENDYQTWDDARKSALVAQIVSSKLSVKAACELHDLSPETIQDWVRVFRRTTLQALDDHLRQTFLIQGADAASLGSAEYTGTLADIPLSDLIQTFQMGARDGVIAVTCAGRRSRLWCRGGEIIDAESGRLRGAAAAYRILALERGQVFADFRGEARERSIEVPANLLLLEAARQKDESARLLERLGGLQAVYRAVLAPGRDASAAEHALLDACDGRHELGELLEQSEQSDLETLSALFALAERGALLRESALASPAALVISKETPSTIVSVDILRSMVSLSPIAATGRPPPRPRRNTPLLVLGAALALGGLVWGVARARSTGRAPAVVSVGEPTSVPSPAARAPRTFELDTVAEPAHAELWLDGLKAGVGRLRRELLQNGQSHSLRVVAEGHAPTTLLFKDAPPPGYVQLEPLSAPAPATLRPEPRRLAAPEPARAIAEPARAIAEPARAIAEPARAIAEPASSAAAEPPRAAAAEPARAVGAEPPRAKRPSPVPPRPPERPRPVERAAAAPSDGAPPSAPRVQIIEPTTPVVRIID